MPENSNYSGALYSLNKSLGKNSWNLYNSTNSKTSSKSLSPKSTGKSAYHSRDSGGVFYFINLQDLQGGHNSEFKVLRLQRKQPKLQPLPQSQKDCNGIANKMVFDVFNRNLYNAASLTNKKKCSVTKSKPKTKKKSAAKKSGQLILSYYQHANKARLVDDNCPVSIEASQQKQEPKIKKQEQKLKSSSLTSDYYNSSQLTVVRKDCGFQPKLCEASSSRIFRMDSFLNNFVPSAKKEDNKGQETKKKKDLVSDEFMNTKQHNKKNNFFPNQTLMATCNKIFDICKLTDSGNTGNFFNFTKNNRTELRLFNKSKIRKKIRDNVFSFKRQKKLSPQALPASNDTTNKLSIMMPCDFEKKEVDSKAAADEVKSINTQSSIYTGVTQSSAYTELQQLSSNSEIYFNQKITAVESTNTSFCQLNEADKAADCVEDAASALDSDDNEIVGINKSQEVLDLDATICSPEEEEAKETIYQHFKHQQNDEADSKMFEDDEEGVLYSYNHYHVPERKNVELGVTAYKKKLTCEIERTCSDLSDSPKIQYLNIIVHRLPGEQLGMTLKVQDNGHIVVVDVTEDGAADRASDLHGNSCSIKPLDCIIEINGVSLHIMKDEDLLSIVQELPLYVQLTLYRSIRVSPTASIVSPHEGFLSIFSHQSSRNLSPETTPANSIPMGYSLFTVYLSSLEAKCIMPCDLTESEDKVAGFFKIQRSTLQIANEEDHLKKDDILYNINGEQLIDKDKFELCSILSSLNGIAEVSVLRKASNSCCFDNEEVPYYNGIFAQNSIKLTMRKYENPAIKSSSEAEFQTLLHSAKTGSSKSVGCEELSLEYENEVMMCDDDDDEGDIDEDDDDDDDDEVGPKKGEETDSLDLSLESEKNLESTQGGMTLPKFDSEATITTTADLANINCYPDTKPMQKDSQIATGAAENFSDLISSLNGQIVNSLHNGNWIFLNKRQAPAPSCNQISPNKNNTTSTNLDNNSLTNYITTQKAYLNDIQRSVSEKLEKHTNLNRASFKSLSSESDHESNDMNVDLDLTDLFEQPTVPILIKSSIARDATTNSANNSTIISASVRSLTSSSCHSVRSLAHLNCLTCFEATDALNKMSNPNLIDLSEVNMYSEEEEVEEEADDTGCYQEALTVPMTSMTELEICDKPVCIDRDSLENMLDKCESIDSVTSEKSVVVVGDGDILRGLVESMVTIVEADVSIEREIFGILMEIVRGIEVKMAVREVIEDNCENVEIVHSMMTNFDVSGVEESVDVTEQSEVITSRNAMEHNFDVTEMAAVHCEVDLNNTGVTVESESEVFSIVHKPVACVNAAVTTASTAAIESGEENYTTGEDSLTISHVYTNMVQMGTTEQVVVGSSESSGDEKPSPSLNKLVKKEDEMCSLKKLIHQELTELIKSKSNTDSNDDSNKQEENLRQAIVNSKSASSLQQQKQQDKKKSSSSLPISTKTEVSESNSNLIPMSHFLPKTMLKSTMQNFLHKQTPTVIYNSMPPANHRSCHRNMRQHTPPPIPPLSPANNNSKCQTPTQAIPQLTTSTQSIHDKCIYKPLLKASNLVFDSQSKVEPPPPLCKTYKYNSSTTNTDDSTRTSSSSGHLNSRDSTQSPTSSFDYVRSALDKQAKQQAVSSQANMSSFSRGSSPFTTRRRLQLEIPREPSKPLSSPLSIEPTNNIKADSSDHKTDELATTSVREKIKIFTNNPIFANKPAVSPGSGTPQTLATKLTKKVYNPVAMSSLQQSKPRPLSQVILEDKLRASNELSMETNQNTINPSINSARKFTAPRLFTNNQVTRTPTETAKKPTNNKYLMPVAPAITDQILKSKVLNSIKPVSQQKQVSQSTESFIGCKKEDNIEQEGEKKFQSVKEKIAYFSSKLYLDKKNDKPVVIRSTAFANKNSVQQQEEASKKPSMVEENSKPGTPQQQRTSNYYDSSHYASYQNLNVIYNQLGSRDNGPMKKIGELGICTTTSVNCVKRINHWKSSGNVGSGCGGNKMDVRSLLATNENKISSLIENLETKWKQHGLNN